MIRLAPRFAELATSTNFSFLRGASHPEELVARAAQLGLTGSGTADRNNPQKAQTKKKAQERAAAAAKAAEAPAA